MSDILTRLRDPELLCKDEEDVLVPLCREAADEIERLRVDLDMARRLIAASRSWDVVA